MLEILTLMLLFPAYNLSMKRISITIGFLFLTIFLTAFTWVIGFIGSTDDSGNFRFSLTDRILQLVFGVVTIIVAYITVQSFKKLKK